MKKVFCWAGVFGLAIAVCSSGASASSRPEQLNCYLEGKTGDGQASCTVIATKCSFEPAEAAWAVESSDCAAIAVICDNGFDVSDPGASMLHGRYGTVIEADQETIREAKNAVLRLRESKQPRTYRARLHTSWNGGQELGYFKGRCVLSTAYEEIG